MIAFTSEEQGSRRYLVYKKRTEDVTDTVAMGMISNNRIEGTAPFVRIQMDETVYMKYDITGLVTLREYLSGTVNRKKLLGALESILDTIMAAEDYMLESSAYVLDMDYIFVNTDTMEISMVVLPVVRKGIEVKTFFRELLSNIQYNQSEDCTYVATLISSFQNSQTFSLDDFKETINKLKLKQMEVKNVTKTREVFSPDRKKQVEPPPLNVDAVVKKEQDEQAEELQEEIEEAKEEKRRFFKRKDKKEKKGLFGRWREEEEVDSTIYGIAIPEMNARNRMSIDNLPKKNKSAQKGYKKQDMAIPVQNVAMKQYKVEQEDFGETVYLDQERDQEETILLEEEQKRGRTRFILRRCCSKEDFEIIEEVTRVGRNSEITEFCITGNYSIGRIHALLYRRDGKVYIEDNKSKNGTYVNDTRIKPEMQPYLLKQGDKVRLGNEELEFHIVE